MHSVVFFHDDNSRAAITPGVAIDDERAAGAARADRVGVGRIGRIDVCLDIPACSTATATIGDYRVICPGATTTASAICFRRISRWRLAINAATRAAEWRACAIAANAIGNTSVTRNAGGTIAALYIYRAATRRPAKAADIPCACLRRPAGNQ